MNVKSIIISINQRNDTRFSCLCRRKAETEEDRDGRPRDGRCVVVVVVVVAFEDSGSLA